MIRFMWALLVCVLSFSVQASASCSSQPGLQLQFFSTSQLSQIASAAAQTTETQFNAAQGQLAAQLTSLFGSTKSAILSKLTAASPLYGSINDDGLALIFTSTLAFELIDACTRINTTMSAIDTINNRATMGVACQGFASLALQLFYQIKPNSTLMVTNFGTSRDSSVDDHSIIAAFGSGTGGGSGVDLFVDPTVSIVAPVSLWGLLTHQSVAQSAIVQFSQRVGNPEGVYRQEDIGMITQGTLDFRTLLYAYSGLSDPANPTFGKTRFLDPTPINRTYQVYDLTSAAASSNITAPAFWYVDGVAGDLWELSSAGLYNTGYNASAISSGTNGIYFIQAKTGYLLAYLTGTSGFFNVTSGGANLQATSMAPHVSNAYLWFVDPSTKLWYTNSAGQAFVGNTGGTTMVVGTGDTVQQLTAGGQLYEATAAHSFTLVDASVHGLWQSKPTGWDFATSPKCQTTSDPACRGDAVKLDAWNGNYGTLYYRDGTKTTPAWAQIHTDVATVLLGYQGPTVNYLTGAGNICYFNSSAEWGVGGYNNELIPSTDWSATTGTPPLPSPPSPWGTLAYYGDPSQSGKLSIQAANSNGYSYYKLSDRWVDAAVNNVACP